MKEALKEVKKNSERGTKGNKKLKRWRKGRTIMDAQGRGDLRRKMCEKNK